MLRDKQQAQHKRNHSQLPGGKTNLPKYKGKPLNNKSQGSRHPKSKTHKQQANSDLVHKLVARSVNKIPYKQVIVDDIQGDIALQQQEEDHFFRFGKKTPKGPTNNLYPMEEIIQVPDTGNCTQRQTEHYHPENKQNSTFHINSQKDSQLQKLRISLDKIDIGKGRQEPSYGRSSKRSKSSRQINCSLSTIELRGAKSRGKSKRKPVKKLLEEDVGKQVKLIWDCISDIWIQNRITQKNSQQNSERIDELIKKSQLYQRDLLSLKMALSERGNIALK